MMLIDTVNNTGGRNEVRTQWEGRKSRQEDTDRGGTTEDSPRFTPLGSRRCSVAVEVE